MEKRSVRTFDKYTTHGDTVDGFIFVGTNFRGLKKNQTFVGFKIRGQSIFSFIIHTENRYFVGTEIRGSDPARKPRKLVPHEN